MNIDVRSCGPHGEPNAEFTFAPLTPTAFMERASAAFADRVAVVDGEQSFTYRAHAARCAGLARGLQQLGVAPADRVAALCSNSHVMLELHQAVPVIGAVLVTLNTRLSIPEMVYILEHSGAGLLVATVEHVEQARMLGAETGIPVVVEGDELEALVHEGGPDPVDVDERAILAINYTSGTTGRPKGVAYHHRGAYLQALAMAYHAKLEPGSGYLWTLPMFHCNGWSFPWAVTAAGATHICIRVLRADTVWSVLLGGAVTHFSAAPTVLTMIAEDPAASELPKPVAVQTGGAPPSPTLLGRIERLGFQVTHLYGLTESFGPVAVNVWQPEWDELSPAERSTLAARQGVANIIARPLRVLNEAGDAVPSDGTTVGELALHGNDLMLGYYRSDEETARVTRAGCFLTGDLAVMHPDGYVQITDRVKDVIISGGENIASVEVERVLDAHPDVVESAVVGRPDEKWGEVPVAFVTVRDQSNVTSKDLTDHLHKHLARFKAPREFIFVELPKTSTGKVQKNVLRTRVADPAADR